MLINKGPACRKKGKWIKHTRLQKGNKIRNSHIRNRNLSNVRNVAAPELETPKTTTFQQCCRQEDCVLWFSYEDADGRFSVICPAAKHHVNAHPESSCGQHLRQELSVYYSQVTCGFSDTRRRTRWLGRLSSRQPKSISRVQFSLSAHTRRDLSVHKKMISGKRKRVS